MKCMKKTIVHECCDIEEILFNPKGGGFPGWVHAAFMDGTLEIDCPEEEPPLLLVQCRTPKGALHEVLKEIREGYVVRDETGWITAMSAEEFDEMYDIID